MPWVMVSPATPHSVQADLLDYRSPEKNLHGALISFHCNKHFPSHHPKCTNYFHNPAVIFARFRRVVRQPRIKAADNRTLLSALTLFLQAVDKEGCCPCNLLKPTPHPWVFSSFGSVFCFLTNILRSGKQWQSPWKCPIQAWMTVSPSSYALELLQSAIFCAECWQARLAV